MRPNRKLISVLAIIAAVALVGTVLISVFGPGTPSTTGGSFKDSDVVAIVNGDPITKAQLYDAMYQQVGAQMVDDLITRRLIEQEAKRRGVTVSAADLDAEIDDLADLYGGRESLEAILNQSGSSVEALRQNLHVNLLVQRMLEPDIEITDEDVRNYFDEHNDDFIEPEQVHARHILVEGREQAEELKQQLDNGADFAELAKEHSTDPGSKDKGGDLGWFDSSTMTPAFSDAAFAAEVGTVVGPVETSFGFHLIEVLDQKAERRLTFEEAEERIRKILLEQGVQEKIGPWLNDLRANAEIELR